MKATSRLIAFNKPYGVLCQFSPAGERATLKDYVQIPGVYPAGRLDANSEGLLLLTDDGVLQNRLSDPKHEKAKVYLAQVESTPDEDSLQRLRSGVLLDGRKTLPAKVQVTGEPPWLWPRNPPIRYRKAIPTTWLELGITEGRNRQIRRMTASVGFPTLRLIRISIGPYTLDQLEPGTWRAVNPLLLTAR